jgi:hypothetical protein
MQILEIVEVLRPAEQGRTTPFLCRGEDELLYYVKGRKAGTRSQYCEWAVAHLARAFGLPIPPFRTVHVSKELLAETSSDYQILGTGVAFASEAQAGAQWFESSFVSEVPQQLRRDVLVFDWWIHNMDRLEDNPNLLWDTDSKKLIVIDHDLAFENEFWPSLFRDHHIFRCEWDSVFGDIVRKAEYATRMNAALSIWEDACDNAPPSWRIKNFGENQGETFDRLSARIILDRCLTEELWSMV